MLYSQMQLNWFVVLIVAIVEGITEFLPVSSTAHIILTLKLLGVKTSAFIEFFEFFIQGGAILVVLGLYYKKFMNDLKNGGRLLKLLFASFVTTAIFGLLFKKILPSAALHSLSTIGVTLAIIGVGFIVIEALISHKKIQLSRTIEDLTLKHAILIGFVQSLAIVPGVSRSGAIILAMLLLGYKRIDAVEYSFMLGLPTILAAIAYKSLEINIFMLPANYILLAFLGAILSYIFAYLAVKWLLKYVKNHDLKIFGWYRILLAGIILVVKS